MINKLMTLDGLIERLTELREIAGGDCRITVGESSDSRMGEKKLTMVSLDSNPLKGTQYVSMLVERIPILHHFVCKETKEEFDSAFIVFEKRNPEWKSNLTDSTYYELAEWYDEYLGMANNDNLSDKAYAFAKYVWDKIK